MKPLVLASIVLMVATVALADVPAIPATPAAVDEVVYARPFTLDEGYKFEWRKDGEVFTQGTILVLKVNPDLVFPRQVAEPVLYVGDTTAERVNSGNGSGYVVAVVPGTVDLKKAPIWFGTPDLPERVDAATIKAERAAAEKAGIKPFSKEQVAAAEKAGGATRLNVADGYELRRDLAGLIQQYSPDETDLVEGLLVPRN